MAEFATASRCKSARAKVNLTLEIRGKRADGYHELESLVLFADFGDELEHFPESACHQRESGAGERRFSGKEIRPGNGPEPRSDAAGTELAPACCPDGSDFTLTVGGPFAGVCSQFAGANLVETAARAFGDFAGQAPRGTFHLTKNIPVAAGLGGGSADAAATLRLLAAAQLPAMAAACFPPPNALAKERRERIFQEGTRSGVGGERDNSTPDNFPHVEAGFDPNRIRTTLALAAAQTVAPDPGCVAPVLAPSPALTALIAVARSIGADVPVCLFSRAAVMTGVGETLHLLARLAPIPAVLVNPMLPLATRDVFRELAAPALAAPPAPPSLPAFGCIGDVLTYARARSNDLEAPARRLLPCIGEVLAALESAPGAVLARLSGSGPTCFALFAEPTEAAVAATAIARAHPGWWVRTASLS